MEPGNIVIRGPNWVGDSVLSIPAIKSVRVRFPNARITLLVRPWVAGLFRSTPFVDAVWEHPKPGLTRWYQTARNMGRTRFDLALLLPNSFESALTAFTAGIRERVGYGTNGRGFLLSRAVPVPEEKQHQVAYYLNLVESTWGGSLPEPSIAIEATPEEKRAARELLRSESVEPDTGLLVLNPGAAFGSAKRWFEDRFAAVADQVAEESNLATVIVGSAAEGEIAGRIRDTMRRRAVLLTGRTDLETLIGVLSLASLMITNDSGPMHIAAALGIPTVAVFGSTDADVTRPVGPRTRVVRHAVACSPCLLRECPIDHRCMETVTVDDVFQAAREIAVEPQPW